MDTSTTPTATPTATTAVNPSRRRRFRRARLLVAALGVVAATVSVVALPVTSGDSALTDSAHAAVRKTITSDYTLLRRGPHSYVIGTGYNGWTVDVQGDPEGGYRWGRVYGNLNFCLWTYAGVVSGESAIGNACGDARSLSTSEFTNGQIGTNAAGNNGVPTTFVARSGCGSYDGTNVTGYGNVKPWEVPASPSQSIATGTPFGARVLWRYVSRDGKFVMVRDPSKGDTDGVGIQGWYFVPRGCLPASLPTS